jgi:tRNA modification GTPase
MSYANHNLSDTIVALATPAGVGAIGVIRLSGPDAIRIVDAVFPGKDLMDQASHTIHYGTIRGEDNTIIDEVMASVFVAPRSYTKENVVEVSCHGSSFIIQRLINLFISKGARMANRGEFTLRAFLNGQMDLSQAEAVADLIASNSETSHAIAMQQMRGGFSDEIKALRQQLIDFASLIELELDFSEEDVEFANRDELKDLIHKIQSVIKRLIDSFHLGNVIKEGVSTVIAGRPNAGKSTLLNALLNEERAIVSAIAGTTRDTVEESLNIKGIQFRLIDTAGIRKAQDQIEQIGVDRTIAKIAQSTVVIYVFDVIESKPEDLWLDVERFLQGSRVLTANSKQLFIANKMDQNPYTKPEEYYKEGLISKANLIPISAKHQMNIEVVKDSLYQLVLDNPHLMDQTIVTNSRHYDALNKTNDSLNAVLHGMDAGITSDFIAMDIRQALHHLGEITGEISTDDLLGNIFSNFCIGK